MRSNRFALAQILQVAALGGAIALAAACGGSPEPAASPATPAASAAPAPAPTDTSATPAPSAAPSAASAAPAPDASALPTSWSDSMTKDQQMAFMKKNILPAMGPVFQAHNATKYADFTCKTCHGPKYQNPHDYLPHLTMKDGKMTAFKEKPEVAKFMAESVSPKMADAMGLPHFDMKTHQGFGCGGCHTVDMK